MDESLTLPFEAPERWLPISGYEDLYWISDLGRVWTTRRKGSAGGLLKASPNIDGYKAVRLWRDARSSARVVHLLVAAAFIGPPPEGQQVCHGPGGRLDNRVVNLCYGTRAKNQGPDRVRDGTSNRGEQNGQSKLTAAIVTECQRRYAAGETQRALAAEFGVTVSTLSVAIRGKTWAYG